MSAHSSPPPSYCTLSERPVITTPEQHEQPRTNIIAESVIRPAARDTMAETKYTRMDIVFYSESVDHAEPVLYFHFIDEDPAWRADLVHDRNRACLRVCEIDHTSDGRKRTISERISVSLLDIPQKDLLVALNREMPDLSKREFVAVTWIMRVLRYLYESLSMSRHRFIKTMTKMSAKVCTPRDHMSPRSYEQWKKDTEEVRNWMTTNEVLRMKASWLLGPM